MMNQYKKLRKRTKGKLCKWYTTCFCFSISCCRYTAEEDFENADAVFDCIGDPPNVNFSLDFCAELLEAPQPVKSSWYFVLLPCTLASLYIREYSHALFQKPKSLVFITFLLIS
jgi:hypothetical protein